MMLGGGDPPYEHRYRVHHSRHQRQRRIDVRRDLHPHQRVGRRLEGVGRSRDDEQLRITLGQGEVSARLDAIGASEIVETHFPGIWWVTHYNVEGDIVADLIEIAAIPNILLSQPEDVRAGLARLHGIISQSASSDESF